jgi:chromatin modification-related protein VID21
MEQQIRAKIPNATPEQIMRIIQEQVSKSVHQQQRQGLGQGIAQSAMNAAAGGNPMGMNGMAGQGTPQLYAQMLRQQQEAQQKHLQAQQQATNAVANGQQAQNIENRNPNPGHAHRGSSGSVQSGK